MQTNFFENIASLNATGTFQLTIHVENQQMVVSVLLTAKDQKDSAAFQIPPMNFKGTAQELDAGFFAALKEPAQKTFALFTNMNAYMEQLEKTKQESRAESDKKANENKTKQTAEKKYEAQMARVNQLETEGKYGEAIGQLPKVADYPQYKEEIENKNQELRSKKGELFA